jgi:hypothetical protein
MSELLYKTHHIEQKTIKEAILSNDGIIFKPQTNIYITNSPKSRSRIHTLWNENEFDKINLPVVLFHLNNDEINMSSKLQDIRILDMPIRFPRSDYRIPHELESLTPLIQKIAFHEHCINQYVDDYYCYITLDRRLVKSGQNTRKAGIHVDGFQGARLEHLLPIDHSYLIYDTLPTIFFNQEFHIESWWDKNIHNYFEGFEQQKKEECSIQYPCNTVLLIDAYTLHEAPMAQVDTYRTFVRLTYTVREFDRLGNAHNPMFNYQWNMLPRNIQDTLIKP